MSVSSTPSLFRHLVLDNPMTLEATRVWRRFTRTGGDTGKGVNITVLSILGVIYIWLLVAILRYREDMSAWFLLMELVLLTLIVPGSMYAAVSGERERMTWDGLIMTSLSPGQIVVGKLLWRVVLILGIAALFVPPLLLCHYATGLMSGESQWQEPFSFGSLFLTQGVVVSWGFLLAGFSLWVSTKTKRTITTLAIITLSLLGFLVLLPVLVVLFNGNTIWRLGDAPLTQLGALLLHLHPFDSISRLYWRSSDGLLDLWTGSNMVTLVPIFYSGGALACTFGAWKTLRGLEEPRAKS